MKLIKIRAVNLPLFENNIEIDFYAEGRISEDSKHEMLHLFKNIYLNRTITFTGINASGKTQILNLISFILNLLQAQPINFSPQLNFSEQHFNPLNLKLGDQVRFEIVFYEEEQEKIGQLVVDIEAQQSIETNYQFKYQIVNEELFEKSISGVRSKKDVFSFNDTDKILSRHKESRLVALSPDVSMLNLFYNISEMKKPFYSELLSFTNFNLLYPCEDIPIELLQFLDPSIEGLKILRNEDGKLSKISLKFIDDEIMYFDSLAELSTVLSSGTIKGCSVFMNALLALKQGGYMIIDEIENHFNREIASTFIQLFTNRRINKNGAVLIYSTHYSELLDILERNDGIYIARKRSAINIRKLSNDIKRNDISKSIQFINGMLENTSPSYESAVKLQKMLLSKIDGDN